MDAINSGISGLKINQEMLDVVGNNLANSNTTGFKSQNVNFSDLVYQNLTQATGASGNAVGGTHPIQIGSRAHKLRPSPPISSRALCKQRAAISTWPCKATASSSSAMARSRSTRAPAP